MASIVQNIMAVAQARLALADGAYEGNCYRPKRDGDYPVRDKVIVLTHTDVEIDAENSCPGNPPRTAFILPIQVSCVIMPDDDDHVSIEERCDDFVVDVMDALTNADDWHQFGGNSLNAELGAPIQNAIPGDDTARGIGFECRVTYRVEETSQSTLA